VKILGKQDSRHNRQNGESNLKAPKPKDKAAHSA
jgi:hypothetical protein